MKKIIFNEDNLSDDEISKTRRKVRGILINNNKILVVRYANLYMFPGGSVENDEDDILALKREILEETGIKIKNNIKPFLKIISYDKNYYDRSGLILNRKTETTYFVISTVEKINKRNIHLTENEKNNDFYQDYFSINDVLLLVENNKSMSPRRKQFDREILTVIDELKKSDFNFLLQ